MTAAASFDLVIVDAFTATPFGGNPAAVCFVDSAAVAPSDALRQQIAAEMNLSETAYVQAVDAAQGAYSLRWFTPQVEVNLCGHATLATAWALFNERRVEARRLSFATLSGELIVERDAHDAALLHMEFPLGAPIAVSLGDATVDALRRALWPADSPSRQCEFRHVHFCAKTRKLTLELADECHVLALKPSAADLVAVFQLGSSSPDVRGVIVTSAGVPPAADYQVVSRYFAPWVGIPEDPVTGSAHTVLAAYYASRLGHTFRARQASQRNGFLVLSTDPARVPAGRVLLSGNACTVLRGKLDLGKYQK
jgi:PhzF family phenazine biosynthesis protein